MIRLLFVVIGLLVWSGVQAEAILEEDLIQQMIAKNNDQSGEILACTGVGENTGYDVTLMKMDGRYVTAINVTDMKSKITYALSQQQMHDQFIGMVERSWNVINQDLYSKMNVRIGYMDGDWYTADFRTVKETFVLALTFEDESATLVTSKVQVEDLNECLQRVNRTMQTYYERY